LRADGRGVTTSVLVLAYNRSDATAKCLANLARDPAFASWDRCVVDNGSAPAERDALRAIAARHPGVRVVRLEQNAGVPGGFNAGLREVRGDPIVFVTNDVLVAPGAVGRMASVFAAHPKAGLAGPVTNDAGCEQRIFIEPGLAPEDALARGAAYADAGSASDSVSAYRLDFFCAALRRSVYDAIGGFDEAFSPGYYDDFDYSLRARAAGFELLVSESAFAYHESGATFGRVNKEKDALIRRNKALFLAKHGARTPLPHVREANLAVLEQYAALSRAGSPAPSLRIANRLRLALADRPRSLVKRWRYLRRVASLEKQLLS
jgi:GT2 family glycosyltransferase